MCNNNYDLNRILEAQNGVYPIALKELQEGWKRSHWMWYIFPQIKRLSMTSILYSIKDTEEAKEYLFLHDVF